MPRDGNGVYTLPAGNPVISGTTITSAWANTTMADVANSLTDSLDRQGRGGMLAPFKFADGTKAFPGAAWTNEPATGLYRAGAGDLRVSVLDTDIMRWNAGEAQVWDGTVWRPVIYQTSTGSVPEGTADGEQLAWDETTDQAWKVVPPPAAGNLPTGTVNRATLQWDTVNWVENTEFVVNADGSFGITLFGVLATGAVSALSYNGRIVETDGATLDAHVADGTIHFSVASINHASIQNIGTNTHAQIDSHIANGAIHMTQATNDARYPIRDANFTHMAVVASLPGSPVATTLYFVTT